MAGIKSVRITVEVDEQMSSQMVATVLRELAHKLELGSHVYARDLSITWTNDSDSFESQ